MESRSSSAGPFDRAVAGALHAAIAERFMTQRAIAHRAGIAERTLARYYMGTSPIPVTRLVEMSDAIGVHPGDIIDGARVIARRAEAGP